MLKIVDQDNKVMYVLRDEDGHPISVDELVIEDHKKKEQEESDESGSK